MPLVIVVVALAAAIPGLGARPGASNQQPEPSNQRPATNQPPAESRFGMLEWRHVGPFRGGRTVGAAGVVQQPNVFYIGVNNGGVWKTTDYGHTWNALFDEQPTQSIGAIAVAPSDPNVVYVGSGEGLQRHDLSV